MLAIERQRRILDLLNESGSLRTTEIAESLGVTDETVRKDFEVLDKRGELVRIHGGASRPEKIRGDLPFNERPIFAQMCNINQLNLTCLVDN